MNPFTWLRILLQLPLSWWAWQRRWRWVAGGVLASGLLDMMDGPLARHDPRFATPHLDSVADRCLTYGICAWLLRLDPALPSRSPRLLGVAVTLWVVLTGISWGRFRQMGSLHLTSSRIGGGVQGLFALDAFWRGRPHPRLWRAALVTFSIAAAEEALVHLLRTADDDQEAIRSVWPLLGRRR